MNNSIDISKDQAKNILSFFARCLGYKQIKLVPSYGGIYWRLSFHKKRDATYVFVVDHNDMRPLYFNKRPTFKLVLKTMIYFAQRGYKIIGFVSKQHDELGHTSRQPVVVIKSYQTLEQVLVEYDLKGCTA